MSLLGALQVGANALNAHQIGLSVTGHNIANANTPGYVREEVEFTPAPSIRQGNVHVGLGVRVSGIVQKVDELCPPEMLANLLEKHFAPLLFD